MPDLTHPNITLQVLLTITTMSMFKRKKKAAASPPQASSTSTSKEPHRESHPRPRKVPFLYLCIRTSRVNLYRHPPETITITSDADVERLMMTDPSNPSSPNDETCLLHGPLADFLLFSRREKSKWLIDIAHDICDPRQKRGKLRVGWGCSDVEGCRCH